MASTDPVKNRGRSKFLTCFKPVADGDEPGGGSISPPCSDSEISRRKKTKLRRSLSGAMKAVFSKTPLVKKLRSKKSRQDLYRSNSESSSTSENLDKKITKKGSSHKGFSDRGANIARTNSSHSSLFSSNSSSLGSSSRASSISSNSRSSSERIKGSGSFDLKENTFKRKNSMKKGGNGKFVFHNHMGLMCMFVVCLVALAFWGKTFAIVTCTSAWLFFAPSRREAHSVDSPEEVVDWEEYKKKVIMDGWLERNRPRVL